MMEFLGEDNSLFEAMDRLGIVSVFSLICLEVWESMGSEQSICSWSVLRSRTGDTGVLVGLGDLSRSFSWICIKSVCLSASLVSCSVGPWGLITFLWWSLASVGYSGLHLVRDRYLIFRRLPGNFLLFSVRGLENRSWDLQQIEKLINFRLKQNNCVDISPMIYWYHQGFTNDKKIEQRKIIYASCFS